MKILGFGLFFFCAPMFINNLMPDIGVTPSIEWLIVGAVGLVAGTLLLFFGK